MSANTQQQQTGAPVSTPDQEPPWPAPAYGWYVTIILTIAYTVSFIDRQILNLLVEPIRHDLGISDVQISLLQGFAFALFYALMGVPIARLADRGNRRTIIAIGIFVWCLMTAACGLARNYLQLFLARVGVGIGEAALSPAAYSLLADYFPPEKLARAAGTYSLGVYAGSGIAMLAGGAVIAWIAGFGEVTLPGIGVLRPWQLAFILVGLPGILIGFLMFTVKEPFRRGVDASKKQVSIREVMQFIADNRWILLSIFVGYSMIGIVVIGILSWSPTYFIRLHGWSMAEVGLRYGLLLLVFGATGAIAGGWFADYLRQRGFDHAPVLASIIMAALSIPCATAMGLVADPWIAFFLLMPATFLPSSMVALSATTIQLMTPNRMRAQLTALYLLAVALLGTGFGPLAVALCTQYIFADDLAVGHSIALVSGTLLPLGVLCLWAGIRKAGKPTAPSTPQ
ncbi:MAG: MFS transporter [Sphingomonadales bacterium]